MDAVSGKVGYLQRMWRLRHFLSSLVAMDLRNRYKGSVLGLGWSLIRPLAMTAAFCLVFCPLFNIGVAEYAPFLLCGFAVWQLLMESVQGGCTCFVAAAAYIRQQPLPLALFPSRTVIGATIQATVALIVVVGLVAFTRAMPGLRAMAALSFSLLLLLVLCWSLAVIMGLVHTHFPDTSHLAEVVFQIIFYITPITYPPELLRSRKGFAIIVDVNPFAHLMDVIRAPMLLGQFPPLKSYIVVCLFVACALSLALYLLRKLEKNLVYWI